MARKLSKKKIYQSKSRKKYFRLNKNRTKKNRLNKKHKRTYKKQKGGNRANKKLEKTIREIMRKEKGTTLTTDKPSKKKGIIKQLISNIPIVGNLVSDPEVEKAQELQDAQDKKQEEQMKKELEDSKSADNREREAMASQVKSTIGEMTGQQDLRPITSLVGESTKAMRDKLVEKTVNKMYGVSNKVAETAKDIKNLATSRQCNAEFITNLDKIIETCGPEELVKVYNEVAQKILAKKQLYSPRLEQQMSKLPILDYNPKIEKEPDLDLKGLAIAEDNRDLIEGLQKSVEKKLKVAEKLKVLDSANTPTVNPQKKKKKKNRKLVLSKITSVNSNNSKA